MKAKIAFIVSLIFLFVCGSVYGEPVSACQNSNGRYQLLQGTYTSIDLKRQQTSTHSGIFLLDTCTGKVKRYLNKIDENGKYVETWVQTELEQKVAE